MRGRKGGILLIRLPTSQKHDTIGREGRSKKRGNFVPLPFSLQRSLSSNCESLSCPYSPAYHFVRFALMKGKLYFHGNGRICLHASGGGVFILEHSPSSMCVCVCVCGCTVPNAPSQYILSVLSANTKKGYAQLTPGEKSPGSTALSK